MTAKPRLTVVDLETYSAKDRARRPDFIRLGGWTTPTGPRLTTDGDEIVQAIYETVDEGGFVSAHRAFAFDLPALAQHHGLDLSRLIGQVIDTEYRVRLDY